MHGLEMIPLYLVAGCFGLAFIIEYALNRRPWLVGFITPVVGYFVSLIALSVAWGPIDVGSAFVVLLMFLFAPIGSLAGSGVARGLRLWIAQRRDSSTNAD